MGQGKEGSGMLFILEEDKPLPVHLARDACIWGELEGNSCSSLPINMGSVAQKSSSASYCIWQIIHDRLNTVGVSLKIEQSGDCKWNK